MPRMAGDSRDQEHRNRALADRLNDYVALIRLAAVRAASRRAAPFRDDIAQAVATAVWRQLDREQPIERPAAYVYKAVVRETVRVLRREQERREVSIETPDAEALTSGADPHAVLEGCQLGAVIDACLDGLSPDRVRAVRGHLAGFEIAEMMRLYGWTYQRARNLVARGMADLRSALRAKGVDR